MKQLKRFFWQFSFDVNLDSLKIGIASILPGLGFRALGYPGIAWLIAAVSIALLAAFVLFPILALWDALCILWMAQLFLAVAISEYKMPVDTSPVATGTFPNTRKRLALPDHLPKGKRLNTLIENELRRQLPTSEKLITAFIGIEDRTNHYWYIGLTPSNIILFRPAQPGAVQYLETIGRLSVSWVHLLNGLRNHVLSVEYQREDSTDSQPVWLHIQGKWLANASAFIKELPGAQSTEMGNVHQTHYTNNNSLAQGCFSIVGLGILLFSIWLSDTHFLTIFFGIPDDVIAGFGLVFMVYMVGWLFALNAIHTFISGSTAIIQRLLGSVFMIIAVVIWLFAINQSHRAITQIINR